MNFKPILFSTPMVQAILEGRKMQTRREIKPQPDFDSAWKNLSKHGSFIAKTFLKESRPASEIPNISVSGGCLGVKAEDGLGTGVCIPNIPIKVYKDDILWVRETFEIVPIENASVYTNESNVRNEVRYKADGEDSFEKWKPSIFMPKAACRIFLEVIDVRVERLQDISEGDAIAEGVRYWSDDNDEDLLDAIFKDYITGDRNLVSSYSSFRSLWLSINGLESWDANPWVWVYDFKQVEKPDNFI